MESFGLLIGLFPSGFGRPPGAFVFFWMAAFCIFGWMAGVCDDLIAGSSGATMDFSIDF